MRTLDEALQARREEKERLAEQRKRQEEAEKAAKELREQEAANLAAGYLAAEYDVEWPDSFEFTAYELGQETGRFAFKISVGVHYSAKVELYAHHLRIREGEIQFIPADGNTTSYIWNVVNQGSRRQNFENLLDAIEHAMS